MHLPSTVARGCGIEMLPFTEMHSPVQTGTPSRSTEGLDSVYQASCILIVDDDPAILMLVSKMVLHLGFRPKTAIDGLDALKAIEKYACRLIITDDEMPKMDGYQLAEQIQRRDLGTPVIIMSAYEAGERLNALVASGRVAGTLLKPFNLKALGNIITVVNDRRPEGWVC
ncbi:MAG: response regulator [Desulfosarcinaceae bacterium]|jgi:CheY-like chemotaxis protein